MKSLWVAEYSPSQDAFHRGPLLKALRSNLNRTMDGDFSDWIIFFVGSPDDTAIACDKVREALDIRVQQVIINVKA